MPAYAARTSFKIWADLPVFLDGGFGPQPVGGEVFETRLMSDDRIEGRSPRPGEGPDGPPSMVIR